MLFFFEIMFLILGFCSLGMALYYGKKNGVIKVFHEVKNLEAMDEVQNNAVDEYGYEDEIYGEVTSADLRKAREDESSELSDREKRRKREENKRKEIKPEKKKRMFNLNDSEAETDLIRKNILVPRISTIVDDKNTNKEPDQKWKGKEKKKNEFLNGNNVAEEETSFMKSESFLNGNDSSEEETCFMKVPDFTTSAASDDEETAFMKSSKPEEICDEEETSFMDSAEEETSFMSAPDEKTPTSESLIAEENALGSRGERMCGDGSNFADEEETGFMDDSSAFADNDEEEPEFMRKEELVRNPTDASRIEDEEETGFMGVSLD